jgi:hypothetical protein
MEVARKAAEEKLAWEKKLEEEKKKALIEFEEAQRKALRAAEEAAHKAAEEKAAWEKKLEEERRRVASAVIKFKDAVGRKFSFPFHLVQTWEVSRSQLSMWLNHDV